MDASLASKSGRKTGSASGYESPLQWLQGTWVGKGQGIFPTIKTFSYNEEIQITGDNSSQRPVLHWRQRSWSSHAVPRLMHVETGWMRVLTSTNEQGHQRIECILSAQNGVNTVEEGCLQDHAIILQSTSIQRSSSARKPYATEFRRRFEVDMTQDPPVMHYTMDMATTTTPDITRHLEATLVRQALPGPPSPTGWPAATPSPTPEMGCVPGYEPFSAMAPTTAVLGSRPTLRSESICSRLSTASTVCGMGSSPSKQSGGNGMHASGLSNMSHTHVNMGNASFSSIGNAAQSNGCSSPSLSNVPDNGYGNAGLNGFSNAHGGSQGNMAGHQAHSALGQGLLSAHFKDQGNRNSRVPAACPFAHLFDEGATRGSDASSKARSVSSSSVGGPPSPVSSPGATWTSDHLSSGDHKAYIKAAVAEAYSGVKPSTDDSSTITGKPGTHTTVTSLPDLNPIIFPRGIKAALSTTPGGSRDSSASQYPETPRLSSDGHIDLPVQFQTSPEVPVTMSRFMNGSVCEATPASEPRPIPDFSKLSLGPRNSPPV